MNNDTPTFDFLKGDDDVIETPIHLLPLTDEQAERINRWIDRRLKLEKILTSKRALDLIASRYYVWADLLEADGRATWLNYE